MTFDINGGTPSLQYAADEMADARIGQTTESEQRFNVYNLGPAVPKIVQRGLTHEEAVILKRTLLDNGVAKEVSIIGYWTTIIRES